MAQAHRLEEAGGDQVGLVRQRALESARPRSPAWESRSSSFPLSSVPGAAWDHTAKHLQDKYECHVVTIALDIGEHAPELPGNIVVVDSLPFLAAIMMPGGEGRRRCQKRRRVDAKLTPWFDGGLLLSLGEQDPQIKVARRRAQELRDRLSL